MSMSDDMSFSDSLSYNIALHKSVNGWMSANREHVLRDQNENDNYKQGFVEDYTQRLREISLG